jgi:hypothetical protein
MPIPQSIKPVIKERKRKAGKFEPAPTLNFNCPIEITRPSNRISIECTPSRKHELKLQAESKVINEESIKRSWENGYDKGIVAGLEMAIRQMDMIRPTVSSNCKVYLEGLLSEVSREQKQSSEC